MERRYNLGNVGKTSSTCCTVNQFAGLLYNKKYVFFTLLFFKYL